MSDIDLLNSIAAAQDIHLFIDVIASDDEKFLLSVKNSKEEAMLVLLEQEQFIDEEDGDIRTRETFTSKDNPSTSDTLLSLFTLCKERYHKEQHINYIANKKINLEIEYNSEKIHVETYKQLHSLIGVSNQKEKFTSKNYLGIKKSALIEIVMHKAPLSILERYILTYKEKLLLLGYMNNFLLQLPMPEYMVDEFQSKGEIRKKELVSEYIDLLGLDKNKFIELRAKDRSDKDNNPIYRQELNSLGLPIYLAMRKDGYTHMQLSYGGNI